MHPFVERHHDEDGGVARGARAFVPDSADDSGGEALPLARSREQRRSKVVRARLSTWVEEQALSPPPPRAGIACGCLVALLLTACGGGGGGGGGGGFTSPGAANVRALDPAQARSFFGPAATYPGTASAVHTEIEQLVGRIQGSRDRSLRLSDISLFTTRDDLNLPPRVATAGQTTSSFNLLGVPVSLSVEELSLGSAASLLPVMRYRGILLVGGSEEVRTTTTSEGPNYPGWIDYSRFPIVSVSQSGAGVFGYGGWLDWSGFFVQGIPMTSGDAHGVSLYYGASIGIASNSRPTQPPGGSATGTWNGVMVATDVSGPGRENIIQGDAALSVVFATNTAGLVFSNVRDLTAGAAREGTGWSMAVQPDGTFSGTNVQGETTGRFYGTGHEEAGGTFNYDDLVGAYGLRRQ